MRWELHGYVFLAIILHFLKNQASNDNFVYIATQQSGFMKK